METEKRSWDGLEDVGAVAGPAAVDSEKGVGVRLHGIFVRVQVHEHFPELEPGANGWIGCDFFCNVRGALTTRQDHQRRCTARCLDRNPSEQMLTCERFSVLLLE